MTIYEYQHSYTGAVHLSRQEDDSVTLCGRNTAQFRQGDETPSGFAATCGTCRRVARKESQQVTPGG
jgi:hypothetical protein